jgi:ATP-dependent protease ClpP protease subunit
MEYQITIDGEIGREQGQITASWLKSQLARADGNPICITFNTEGGSVFEALSMFDSIRSYAGPKRCIVENAFSMGSVLAMAFDNRAITPNGYLMLHNPYIDDDSEPSVLGQLRTRLAKIYSAATHKPLGMIQTWMNGETFFDSGESVRLGFVGSIVGSSSRAIAAFQGMVKRNDRFRSCIVAKLGSQPTMTTAARWKAAVTESMLTGLDRTKAVANVDRLHPGLRQRMIHEANGR